MSLKLRSIPGAEKLINGKSPSDFRAETSKAPSIYKLPVPLFLTKGQQLLLGSRLLINAAYLRNEKTIVLKVFFEIKDIIENNTNSITLKKKKDLYKLAIENKFFVKYL